MAQRANLVVNDAAATPVAHTFVPTKVIDDVNLSSAVWVDRASSILLAQPTFVATIRRPSKQSKNTRITLRLTMPVAETISGSSASGLAPVPSLAYANFAELTYVIHERSDLQSRKDLRELMTNLNSNVGNIRPIVWDYDFPY